MTSLLNSAIVRVHTSDKQIVGTGFLVQERKVLTCAHVVAQALNLPADAKKLPQELPSDEVCIDFPLVMPEQYTTARVIHFQPQSDVAGLIIDPDFPLKCSPVRLSAAHDLWEHHLRAFGFPEGRDMGVWVRGELLGRNAAGWVQIEGKTEVGYFIQPGFSGGPVWDETVDSVVGMVVATDTQPNIRAAFLIPMDMLASAWPDVMSGALLDAEMDRLRKRRDEADNKRRELLERRFVVNLRPLDMIHTFKDRLREIRALYDHLADNSVRLISVVGRGGMGKTALVSRALADLEQGVLPISSENGLMAIDGIIYLSARTTGISLERIYADVGRMLGKTTASKLASRWANKEISLAAKVEYLLETLEDGRYIILLDNLEDCLTPEGEIAQEGLLTFVERCTMQSSGVRLVVTSREAVQLTSSALGRARRISLREGLPEDEAIALLRELDPQGLLGLRNASDTTLHRAVQLTQGIPRALEIIVGILNWDPTANLKDLLTDNWLGEQVIEQLLAESYQSLGQNEQRVLEALSVFDRPVNGTAVDYLLYPWFPGMDVRASLRRLARSYFVNFSRFTSNYSLHPLDRDYAYSQIPLSPSEDTELKRYNRRELELRAADFYADIRKPETQWKSIDDLAPQLAEFEHCVRAEDYDRAAHVLDIMNYDYLFLWGYVNRLLEMRQKLIGNLANPNLEMTNLGDLGIIYRILGQSELGIELLEKALSRSRETHDRRNESVWLGNLGIAYRELGKDKKAIKLLEDALVIAREISNRRDEGVWLGNLGIAYLAPGQIRQAIQVLEYALKIAREVGDRRSEGSRLGNLASAYFRVGQHKRAIGLYKQALDIAYEIDDRFYIGTWQCNLGIIHHTLGQVKQAIQLFEQALLIARDVGNRSGEGRYLNNLGRAYHSLGQIGKAVELHSQSLSIAYEVGNRRAESHGLLGLGRTHLSGSNFEQAARYCKQALALDVPETGFLAALTLGITLLHQDNSAAKEGFAKAVDLCHARLNLTEDLYATRYALATALLGKAVCHPDWKENQQLDDLLAPSLAEYRRAIGISAAPGILHDVLCDLESIRAAGVEGLGPIFSLLDSAKDKNKQEWNDTEFDATIA